MVDEVCSLLANMSGTQIMTVVSLQTQNVWASLTIDQRP